MRTLARFTRSLRPPSLRLLACWLGVVAALLVPVSALATKTSNCAEKDVGPSDSVHVYVCKQNASSCGSSWECATLNVTPKAPEGGCACWNDFPKASNAYFTTGGWSCTSDGSGGWTLN